MTQFEQQPQGQPQSSASADASASVDRPAEGHAERRAESIHDFAGKLKQPSVWPQVAEYVTWQRAARRAAKAGEAPPPPPQMAPISINLDLTTACNYACDHCIDWDILNQPTKHEDEDLREAMRIMAARGMKSVILIGGGEPTLYPGFVSFVELLKELDLQVAVVSNGSRNDRILQIAPFLDERDWVRLSLDSGRNDTFRAMHNPSKKTLDLDEICSWVPKIKAVNPRFKMGFSYIITWKGASRDDVKVIENIDQMVEAAQRAQEAQFDYISFKPFLERSDEGSEVMDPEHVEGELRKIVARIDANIAEAKRFEIGGFKVMESTNLRMLLGDAWKEFTKQPKTCHFQALRQVLTPLGTFNCPAYRGVGRAQVGEKDIYKDGAHADHAADQTARLLRDFDASHECREVTCLYNKANWWLEDLIESDRDPASVPTVDEQKDYFL